MSTHFVAWRAKHFVPVSDYGWKPKNLATEVAIRSELARHAVREIGRHRATLWKFHDAL